jgi:hypothetical protein
MKEKKYYLNEFLSAAGDFKGPSPPLTGDKIPPLSPLADDDKLQRLSFE